MDTPTFFTVAKEYWAVILGALGAAAWMARLESRGIRNSADIERTVGLIAQLEGRFERQRAEDLARQTKEQDEMKAMLKDMQQDIKTLLQRRGD